MAVHFEARRLIGKMIISMALGLRIKLVEVVVALLFNVQS